MKFKTIVLFTTLMCITFSLSAQKIIPLNSDFNKIIVSPHLAVTFKKGTTQSVTIESINVPIEKFQYELQNGTLQVYLEGAKTYTKNKKVVLKNKERKIPLYTGRVAQLLITYVAADTFSLRGEEKITFASPIAQKECKLSIYGRSEVTIRDLLVDKFNVSIYGDSFLKVENGAVKKQKIVAYGASKIMATDLIAKETKVTVYGNGTFQLHATQKIKVTAFGEATILYKGNAQLKKGIIIGEATISKIL